MQEPITDSKHGLVSAETAQALEAEVAALRRQLALVSTQAPQGLAPDASVAGELEFTEARYRALLELTPQVVCVTDSQGSAIYKNRHWYDFTGMTMEQSLGTGWLAAIHPDDMENMGRTWIAAVREGAPYENEFRFRRADGEYRWHLARANPLKDSTGKIVNWLAVSVDIHERKTAGAALAEAEERLRVVMDAAGLGACNYFPARNRMEFTPLTYQILHLSPDTEPSLETMLSCAHPDDRSHIQEVVGGLLQGGVSGDYDIEHRIVWPDGTIRWVHCRGKCAFPPGGEPRLSGVVMDITERKQAELERTTLNTAIQHSPDFIGITDRKGNIVFLNQAGQRMVGLRDDAQAQSKAVRDFVLPEEQKILDEQILPVIRAKRVWEGEFRLRHFVTGEPIVVDTRGFGIFDASGRITNIATVSRDMSEQKKLQEQLQLAQKMEAVGQLAGGIAHDFNNLMTIIRGASDVLEARVQHSDGSARIVDEIREAAERASTLTQQLLAFGRRQMVRPTVLNLNQVLTHTGDMLRRLLGEDIQIATDLAPDLWNVKVDPVQIDQILLNLASNARDAMPQGGSISIRTRNRDWIEPPTGQSLLQPGQYVMLEFADTGAGMDAGTLKRVFDPFFTTKVLGKGTGMGLATVYGIVQQSGGHISVASQQNTGTIFEILLPRTAEDATQEVASAHAAAANGHARILLVEDEGSLRDLIAEYVREKGYTVLEAANAQEAMAQADVQTIDLLITDIVMPGESGERLASSLLERQPDVAVIFVSGYAEHAALEEALKRPNVVFLQKPFRFGELLNKIQQVLGSATASKALKTPAS
jgi:PAS domain S-box-containing protein